jgi:glycosyltransferase involved in cell wall biosynthesis
VLLNSFKDASVLLTPHQTEPEEAIDTIIDNEICSLKHGIYNLGFLGVKPSPEGLRFARWWRDRLHRFCRADIPAGLFTDQRWVDLAPAFFTDLHILRHPGCNVSTWNLSHRHIEGTLADGFTVNGLPLIFYHFSGFDSGDQAIMLGKYGRHMPAAHTLRQWYLSRTERTEDKTFSKRRWTYSFFSNGEAIAAEQRHLFRDRKDLQEAFPDPFEVPGPGVGFYYWYKAEVLGQRPSMESSSPPELRVGPDLEQLAPAPCVTTAPGDHRTGAGPETSLYEPERDRRSMRSIVQWATGKGPVILFVGHYGDGGTEKHVRELVDHIGHRSRILLLTPKYDGTVSLSTLPAGKCAAICFHPIDQLDNLVEVLTACHLDRIHIHHALGNDHYLEHLVRRLGKPFDFTVHDYYALSPNPQLIGPDNRFVGEDLAANAEHLLAKSMCPKRPTSLIAWQTACRWLLADAARVIVPSHDVSRRLRANLPQLNPIVAYHPEIRGPHEPIHLERIDPETRLRIAVLGQISPHKGHDVLRKCASMVQENKHPLSFDLIGQPVADAKSLEKAGVRISGPYKDRDIQKLIQDRHPHLIWYPALWPETFSYTLSAGLEARLPLVVPNLGAFPERVAGRKWTWVCSWDRAPIEWVAFFLHIRDAHFAVGLEPETPGGVLPKDGNFYEHEYFSWRDEPSEAVLQGVVETDRIQKGRA